MNGLILFMAAGLGIQYGWQQADDGTVEYIVQVDEAGLAALRDGLPLSAAVPSDLNRIDRVRIQFGDAPLPRTRIVNHKPDVVAANFNETSSGTVSDREKQFADSIREIPGKLDTNRLKDMVPSAEELSETAQSVLIQAADQAPELVSQFINNQQTGDSSPPPPTSFQAQPRVRPASGQQEYKQYSGQQSVTNSTLNSRVSNKTQSGFGQPQSRVADSGGNQNNTSSTDWQNVQANQQGTSGQQPNDNRQIGEYQPNRTGNPADYQTNQQGTPNSTMDSREGQTTIRRQAPDYQNAFSAGDTQTRDNNFDLYANEQDSYNMEPVRPRSNTGTYNGQQQDGSGYNPYPNRQFNSGQSGQNTGQNTGQYIGQNNGQNNQQQNPQSGQYAGQVPGQYPSSTYPPNPYLQPTWPGTTPGTNVAQTYPWQIPGYPAPGTNPYAQPGVWGTQPLNPATGYNPYYTTRGTQETEEQITKRIEKKFDDKLAELEKIELLRSKTNQASNEIGTQLQSSKEPVKPSTQWATLLVFLFGSIGANFYLAWIGLSFYHRYRTLSEDMRDSLNDRLDSR